jgi:GNAT superfamily N-acetyltransferase
MRPTLTIRKAEPAVLPALDALREEAVVWLASKGLDQWQPGQPRVPTSASTLDAIERGACYLAYEGDELVGTITVDDRADPEFWTEAERAQPALYIHRMIVPRHAAGRSVGATLLDWAESHARATGRALLRLDAWKLNVGLHRYYESLGFEHIRTVDLPHRGSGGLFQREVVACATNPAGGVGTSRATSQSDRKPPGHRDDR